MLAIAKWGVFIPSLSFSVHLLMNFDKSYFMSQEGAHYTVEQIVRLCTVQLLLLTLPHLIVKVIPFYRASKNSGKQEKAQQRWRTWGRAKSRILVERYFLIGLSWRSTMLINASSQLCLFKIQTHWSAALHRAIQLGTLIFVYYYWLENCKPLTKRSTITHALFYWWLPISRYCMSHPKLHSLKKKNTNIFLLDEQLPKV